MKRSLVLATLAVAIAAVSANPSTAYADTSGHKVLVCHVPPGNPDNTHEIVIDEHAVPAHLAHGDALGSCNPVILPPLD